MIRKSGSKWILYSKDRSKVLGVHTSEADAKRQEAAVNISKARAAGHEIPKKK